MSSETFEDDLQVIQQIREYIDQHINSGSLEERIQRLPPPVSFNEPKSWEKDDYIISTDPKMLWVEADSIVGGTNDIFKGTWMTKDSSQRSNIAFFEKIAKGILEPNGNYGNFITAPIKVIEVDGKYYVSTDGRHRVAVLKALGVKNIPVYLETKYESIQTTHIVFCKLLLSMDPRYLDRYLKPNIFLKYQGLVTKYRDSGVNFIAIFIRNFITELRRSNNQITLEKIKQIYIEKLSEFSQYTGLHPLSEDNILSVDLDLLNQSKWEELAESLFMQVT